MQKFNLGTHVCFWAAGCLSLSLASVFCSTLARHMRFRLAKITQNPPLPTENEQNRLFNVEINVSAYICRPAPAAVQHYFTSFALESRRRIRSLACVLFNQLETMCRVALLSRVVCVCSAVVPLSQLVRLHQILGQAHI